VAEIASLEKLLVGCEKSVDDQRWFTDKFLHQQPDVRIGLDYNCDFAQTFAHCWPWPHQKWSDHFGLEGGRVVNWTMRGSKPVVVHANGGGASSNYAAWAMDD
jgi:hypothetical protein